MGGAKSRIFGIDAEAAFGEQQIAEDEAGNLEFVDDVEDFRDQREAVADVERGGNDAGIVAEGCAEHLPEVALFGFGGDAGGRARALAVDDDDGNFGHGGEAEALRT